MNGPQATHSPAVEAAFRFEIGGNKYEAWYGRKNVVSGALAGMQARPLVHICLPPEEQVAIARRHYRAAAIGLHHGTDDQMRRWASVLNGRLHEATASIRAEGVIAESWFGLQIDSAPYVFCVLVCGPNLDATTPGPTVPELEVDRAHREFKKTWDRTRLVLCQVANASD